MRRPTNQFPGARSISPPSQKEFILAPAFIAMGPHHNNKASSAVIADPVYEIRRNSGSGDYSIRRTMYCHRGSRLNTRLGIKTWVAYSLPTCCQQRTRVGRRFCCPLCSALGPVVLLLSLLQHSYLATVSPGLIKRDHQGCQRPSAVRREQVTHHSPVIDPPHPSRPSPPHGKTTTSLSIHLWHVFRVLQRE